MLVTYFTSQEFFYERHTPLGYPETRNPRWDFHFPESVLKHFFPFQEKGFRYMDKIVHSLTDAHLVNCPTLKFGTQPLSERFPWIWASDSFSAATLLKVIVIAFSHKIDVLAPFSQRPLVLDVSLHCSTWANVLSSLMYNTVCVLLHFRSAVQDRMKMCICQRFSHAGFNHLFLCH